MSEETIDVTLGTTSFSCQEIDSKQVGIYWEVKVRCADGTTRTARAANKNEARQLACLKCADKLSEETAE